MLLFNAAVLVVTGCTLWAMRTEALSNGLEMSRTYAGNFENYVSQSLRATETSLAQAVQLKNNAIALRETQTTLQVLQQQSPSLRSLTLIDDENRVVLSSNPANVGLTLAASSPWFTSDAHTQEARIGAPWAGRDWVSATPSTPQTPVPAGEPYFVPLLRTVDASGHTLRLLATLSPDFYLQHAAQSLGSADSQLQVFSSDGVLLLDTGVQARIGSVWDGFAAELLPDKTLSGTLVRTNESGATELVAFKTSDMYPMVVVSRRSQDAVLRHWKRQAQTIAAVVLPALLILSLFVSEYLRRQRLFLLQERDVERLQRINTTVFAASADAIIVTDPDTRILSVNAAFTRITGYSAQEAIGRTTKFLASGLHTRPFYKTMWDELLLNGVWHGEAINRNKDGSLYNARLSITASRDNQGNLQHFICIAGDVTTYNLAQRALDESHNLLASVINTAPLRVFWKDKELRYLGCNVAFAQDAGVSQPSELIGKTDLDLSWAKQADQYRADDREVIQSGVPKLSYDEPQTKPDGEVLWLRTSKVPLRGHDGAIIGLLGIYEDISEYKRSQKALEISEERFRRTFYLTPDSLIVSRVSDGLIVSVNLGFSQMTGYSATDAIGKTAGALNLWADPGDRKRLVDALAQNGSVSNLEAAFRGKDGRTVPGLVSASVIDLDGVPHMLSLIRDISERKKAEESLSLAASVFANSREGIMITAVDGTIIDVNDAFTNITGYARDEVLGRNPRILNSGRQGKDYYSKMWSGLFEKGHWYGEIWNRRKDGEVYAEMQTITTVRDRQGKPQHFVSLFSDISVYKQHQNQLEHIAHYDALTGLPNRVLLADRMRQGIAHVQRRKLLLAVAFLDLDGFKAVNDSHGHEAGDQLLVTVAARMKQALREGDTLARMGGDEFVAVLVDLPDVEASVHMLTRLLEAASQPFQWGDVMLQVSASVGVTFYPQEDLVDADQMLRQADQAMYQAKLAGKNRYHVFDAEQDRSVRGHHEDLESIRRALRVREFVLHYQPKVNMRTGAVVGAEALIRWQHPSRGLLAPGLFLPIIEDQPLAIEVGEWVIDTVLAQSLVWHQQGLRIPVSVNIGARQLQQFNFVGRLRDKLARYPDLPAGLLELEVLETSALEDLTHVSRLIQECRQMGVHFALDDFGTGYSSLTYLKLLPVSQLKIDQSFVRDMMVEPDDLAILEGTIGLAHAFRRQVIAEGVESVETGRMLLQLGCELAQGYCIAKPMPAQDFPGWMASWKTDPAWLNQAEASRANRPLLFAGVEYRAWVVALEHFVQDTRELAPPIDLDQNRLGTWLNNGGLSNHHNRAGVQTARRLHHESQLLATHLLQWHAQGDRRAVADGVQQLHGLRDSFLEALQVLLRQS
jgi:diguanylate cyclase (GGDEF)-like protein/PAS domain S-box-containing protein